MYTRGNKKVILIFHNKKPTKHKRITENRKSTGKNHNETKTWSLKSYKIDKPVFRLTEKR